MHKMKYSSAFLVTLATLLYFAGPISFVGPRRRMKMPVRSVAQSASSRDEDWSLACTKWLGICKVTPVFEAGYFIQFLHKDLRQFRYGRIDKVDGPKAYVQVKLGVLLELDTTNSIWSYVPENFLKRAKTVVDASAKLPDILKWTTEEGIKPIILANAAEGLFGGARTMSGLKNLGCGSAVGGIIVVAAYPSTMAADELANLAQAVSNDPDTTQVVQIAGYGGAATGTFVAITLVAEGGVSGLSAAGITSGLAALGGSMLGGLAAVAMIGFVATVVVAGVAYSIKSAFAQKELRRQRQEIEKLALTLEFEFEV
eukprot:TRINITY_DN21812_c0_g1_i2.p1 TRINITY_DN21812_c0_g1~~TRINITY_DN21812_c0_g1_i2.p1  ORF type:complete len:313 (-),score=46.33 TRINITY_DN21812_c0_g1_i2:83-1021(-)